jgi:microcystin-dependent protein
MTQPYIAQIALFSFSFAPRYWAFCNGALQSISQNQALFALIGTTYGGDGRTTFALPNIQDRTVLNIGQGPGLSNYTLGEPLGAATVTLMQSQMPAHNHQANATAADVLTDYVLGVDQNYWIGKQDTGQGLLFAPTPDGHTFAPQTIASAGGSQPHMNEQPYLGMNYCIALYGIFPSRN